MPSRWGTMVRADPRGSATRVRASGSPRIGSWSTISTGFPLLVRPGTNRSPDNTVSEEPRTSSEDASPTSSGQCSTRGGGTASPKNTTSGWRTPPHSVFDWLHRDADGYRRRSEFAALRSQFRTSDDPCEPGNLMCGPVGAG